MSCDHHCKGIVHHLLNSIDGFMLAQRLGHAWGWEFLFQYGIGSIVIELIITVGLQFDIKTCSGLELLSDSRLYKSDLPCLTIAWQHFMWMENVACQFLTINEIGRDGVSLAGKMKIDEFPEG